MMVDLGYHGWFDPPLRFSDPDKLYPPSIASIDFLKKNLGGYRVLEIQRRKPFPERPLKDYHQLGPYRRRGNRSFDFDSFDFVARPDSLMPYGIHSAGGYLSLYPKAFRELWNGSGNDTIQSAMPGEAIDRWSGGWIDMQGIRYILTSPHSRSDVYPVAYQDAGITIFENKKALPRLFLVDQFQIAASATQSLAQLRSASFSPATTVILNAPPGFHAAPQKLQWAIAQRHESEGAMTVDAVTNKEAILVFSDNFFPGWVATVDAHPVPILRANCVFRAIVVPAGKHTIRFEFSPPELSWGLRTLVAALACWALILVVSTRNRENKP
jgi:membrane protein YfhO